MKVTIKILNIEVLGTCINELVTKVTQQVQLVE